jgi:hypothetical protein
MNVPTWHVVPTAGGETAVFIRGKIVKDALYYQLIEGFRDNGRVRHRTVISLGQNETIEEAIEENERHIRRDKRRLKKLDAEYPDLDAVPGRVVRETQMLRARLTRQEARRDRLAEVQKRLWHWHNNRRGPS